MYCIGLLDFKFSDYGDESEQGEVVHTHTLKNQHNRQVYNKLTYIYLEMPNFNKKENELETRLDQWLYFIKNLESFQAIPEIFKNQVVFVEAIEKAELARMSEEAQATYYEGLKAYRDNLSQIKTGIEEERIKIAKNCLKNGLSIEMTAKLTGLSEDEISKLQNHF